MLFLTILARQERNMSENKKKSRLQLNRRSFSQGHRRYGRYWRHRCISSHICLAINKLAWNGHNRRLYDRERLAEL
jgi:hypothetical protein